MSLGKLKREEDNNFQRYNVLSTYEVIDKSSTSNTYVSHMVEFWILLVNNELQVLFIVVLYLNTIDF